MRLSNRAMMIAAIAGAVAVSARVGGAAPGDSAAAVPDEVVQTDVDRLPEEAARLYAAVMKSRPGELKWQQIPWLVELDEAIRLAGDEKRPLLIFVSGDDPLEKC